MTGEPMTDAELERWERFAPPPDEAAGICRDVMSMLARIRHERSRADAAEAERDAAVEEQRILSKEIVALRADLDAVVARAMPGWRYLATWDAVNAVEARHNDEPAPGLYAVWKPGWPYPSAASVQFGVFATDEESPAPDDYLLGAWISGPLPLPDLPTPTAGEKP